MAAASVDRFISSDRALREYEQLVGKSVPVVWEAMDEQYKFDLQFAAIIAILGLVSHGVWAAKASQKPATA